MTARLSGSTRLTVLSWSKDSPKSDDKGIDGKFRKLLVLVQQRPRTLNCEPLL